MLVSIVMNFNGNATEAINLYADVFGVEKPNIMTYGSVPSNPAAPPISEEEKDYVVMATMNIHGMPIMFQDLMKPMQTTFNSNITVSIGSREESDIRNWFDKMKEGGMVTCPLQPMPWSKCYGAVKDKFGTSWQFGLE